MNTQMKKEMLKFWNVKFVPKASSSPKPSSENPKINRTPSTTISTYDPSSPRCIEKQKLLDELKEQVEHCKKCPLYQTRTQIVFGEGNPDADILFVGEAPGFEEDRQGRPFVGRAGKLLTDIITKGMGLNREDIYIGNVLKCRPPQNRTPSAQEIVACSPYLFEQIKIIRPKIIIALGSPALRTLLDTKESITKLRGRFYDYYVNGPLMSSGEAIKLMPTFHPAYLLRNPNEKIKVWEDIKQVLRYLGLPIPTRTRGKK